MKRLFDLFCLCSLVGIWPRYFAPYRIKTSHVCVHLPKMKWDEGFRLVQLSDLHVYSETASQHLDRAVQIINTLRPHLIVITGDLICQGNLDRPERLFSFLRALRAECGVYVILGNHDYDQYVGLDKEGIYSAQTESEPLLLRGLNRLLFPPVPQGKFHSNLSTLRPHPGLCSLVQESGCTLLENQTVTIPFKRQSFNLTGLGEYSANRCQPQIAYRNYDPNLPGILLVHNPDATPSLLGCPGDLILSGHTHGAQINLPGLRNRFLLSEYPKLVKGLYRIRDKRLYINRGLGSLFPFRLFSPPEITLFTFSKNQPETPSRNFYS